jgi:hypothetical protein
LRPMARVDRANGVRVSCSILRSIAAARSVRSARSLPASCATAAILPCGVFRAA